MDKLFIIVIVLGVLLVILVMFKSYLEDKNLHPTNEYQPYNGGFPTTQWTDLSWQDQAFGVLSGQLIFQNLASLF